MRGFLAVVTAALVTLTGCANVQPVVNPAARLNADAGYLAGHFSRMKSRGYAFIVKAVDGGKDYTMPLGEDSNLPTEVKDQTVAIQLPPGTYTVSQWITYATLTKEVMSRRPIQGALAGQQIVVKAGGVTHLGSFDVSQWQSGYTWHLRIQPRRFTQAQGHAALAETYPNLAEQPFSCILCVDTGGLGAP